MSVSGYSSVLFPYHTLRNIATQSEIVNRNYVGYTHIKNIIELTTDANVRDALNRKHDVQNKILGTLNDTPEKFHLLNNGVTIVAKNALVDDKSRIIQLTDPSIINGAQTQRQIINFIEENKSSSSKFENTLIKYEIIVTDNDDLASDISVARNYQIPVELLSIVGITGKFDDLESAMRSVYPTCRLQRKETEKIDEVILDSKNRIANIGTIDTVNLIQVITTIIPEEMQYDPPLPQPSHSYNSTRSLKNFQSLYQAYYTKDPTQDDRVDEKRELYRFFMDIAPYAYEQYHYWKRHSSWGSAKVFDRKERKDSRRNSEERRVRGKSVQAPDGILFPLLQGLSIFCRKVDGHWTLKIPSNWSARKERKERPATTEEEYYEQILEIYKEIAQSNVGKMGLTPRCYESARDACIRLNEMTNKDEKLAEQAALIARLENELASRNKHNQ